MILSPHEIAWLTVNIGEWTVEDGTVMTAIALAESGGNTDIMGRSPASSRFPGQRDHGLFQISGHWWGDKLQELRWRDPYDNTRIARKVWNAQGFAAWTVYNTGAYLEHLPDATEGMLYPFEPVNPHTTAWRYR